MKQSWSERNVFTPCSNFVVCSWRGGGGGGGGGELVSSYAGHFKQDSG